MSTQNTWITVCLSPLLTGWLIYVASYSPQKDSIEHNSFNSVLLLGCVILVLITVLYNPIQWEMQTLNLQHEVTERQHYTIDTVEILQCTQSFTIHRNNCPSLDN